MKIPTLNVVIDYDLIAINTTLEDYLLALNVNKKLKTSLARTPKDLILERNNQKIELVQYSFEDETNYLYWRLIQNRKLVEVSDNSFSLFGQTQQLVFLCPELKNADFLLKIEGIESDDFYKEHIISQIKKIKQISTAFFVDIDRLNVKNNLLF